MTISKTDGSLRLTTVRRAVRALGLAEKTLCVHSSLRSFGHVSGGAATILQGLLQEGCTVMVPTFTYDNQVPLPADQQLPQNGSDYPDASAPKDARARPTLYTPAGNDISDDMGALPRALLDLPERVRGDHPLNAFAAAGPHAHALIAGQTSLEVYAPFRELAALGGSVLLMGVGLTRMTLLHDAEALAGRNLFWRGANDRVGNPVGVRVGSCSEGFEALAPALADLETTRTVGRSAWRSYPVRETLERAAAALRADPGLTHCADPACARCRDAALGGPPDDPAFAARLVRSWR